MGNFIRFILRNLHFIVFVILEIVSISLAVNFDNRRKSIFLSTSNHFSGFVQSHFSQVAGYFKLSGVNDELLHENAQLRNQLLNLEQQVAIQNLKPDSMAISTMDEYGPQRYRVIPAHVISNSFSSLYNFLTIDVGADKGMKPGMGVITNTGPVGIITQVNKYYSKVISVYNIESLVSAKIKHNNALGIIQWEPYSLQTVVMREIPRHVELAIGDTVVTSGYSFAFPPGLPIGEIEYFNLESGENDYTVYVRLFEDLYTLRLCYVIEDTWNNPDTFSESDLEELTE